jgi:prolyl-tRNA synthetase
VRRRTLVVAEDDRGPTHFHLGDRYRATLGAGIKSIEATGASKPMQMGCHGTDVSRFRAAVASAFHHVREGLS